MKQKELLNYLKTNKQKLAAFSKFIKKSDSQTLRLVEKQEDYSLKIWEHFSKRQDFRG